MFLKYLFAILFLAGSCYYVARSWRNVKPLINFLKKISQSTIDRILYFYSKTNLPQFDFNMKPHFPSMKIIVPVQEQPQPVAVKEEAIKEKTVKEETVKEETVKEDTVTIDDDMISMKPLNQYIKIIINEAINKKGEQTPVENLMRKIDNLRAEIKLRLKRGLSKNTVRDEIVLAFNFKTESQVINDTLKRIKDTLIEIIN